MYSRLIDHGAMPSISSDRILSSRLGTRQGASVSSTLRVRIPDECQVARNISRGFHVDCLLPLPYIST